MAGFCKPRRFTPPASPGKSGLQVPRFVSLKTGRVNVRVGPGEDYKIAWVFTRTGLPHRGHPGIRYLAAHPNDAPPLAEAQTVLPAPKRPMPVRNPAHLLAY